MALVLTEEQEMLQRTARDFVRERARVSHLRALRDTRDPVGFSREIWLELAGLGLIGIPFPEAVGGVGLGYAELGPVLEELGRQLVPTPYISTVLLGGNAILLGGTDRHRSDLLPSVCAGERILAMAFQEGFHFAPWRQETRAEAVGDRFHLTGEKVFVLDGHVADHLIVAARTSGRPGARSGITLFLVDRDTPGLTITRTIMVDSHNAARIRLEGVEVDRSRVVGEVDRGAGLLEAVLDRATIALCSEMLGSLQEAFDRTIAYLKERRQFGVLIGSFQALKHRAAQMFCEVELSRSIVLDALRALDEARPDIPQRASIAKARCSDVFLRVANEAIQMHGGIGMTDELDIGFYLKRARVTELSFGDAAYHRARFADLEGY